ncbi:hypothetical protein T484DRAFT_1941413 [Baffinella frigidus]|nr:hypothetical protein T484DRAFT_1941413 [Cryptophyta sp. CCMP2293]
MSEAPQYVALWHLCWCVLSCNSLSCLALPRMLGSNPRQGVASLPATPTTWRLLTGLAALMDGSLTNIAARGVQTGQ